MVLTVYTPNNFSIKNITENHIEIINYGYTPSSFLKLYEINYDHKTKYPSTASLVVDNLSICDDAYSINTTIDKCG